MKKSVASVAVAIAVIAAPAAYADDGAYVGVSGILSSVSDVDFDNDRSGRTTDNTVEFDVGFGGGVRVGYRIDSWRVELEGAYRKLDVDSVAVGTNASGEVDTATGFLNIAYDIDIEDEAITPYVMLGGGFLYAAGDVRWEGTSPLGEGTNFDGTAPAGQAGVGVSYAVSEEVDIVGGYTFIGAPTDKSGKQNLIQVHSVMLGLNYNF